MTPASKGGQTVALSTVAFVVPPRTWQAMFRDADLELLRRHAQVVGPVDIEAIRKGEAGADGAVALVSGWGTGKIDPPALDRLPKLKLLAHSAGTVKGVVTDAVYDRGVRVTTAASANAVPVAEFTVAMMVTLLKQTPWLSEAMRRCDRVEHERRYALVRELQDMSIGLIGASRVGREVIRLLKSYSGLDVKVYDPYLSAEEAGMLGVSRCTLEEACACEVVSVHAPSVPATRHMLNARTLALIPDHGVLINTARGALIDEEALVAEVRRRPLYAALDVTDPEPPRADSPLRSERNIVLTPHIAGAMRQARRSMGRLAIEEVLRHLRGEAPLHEVTREMLASQA